MLDWLKHAWCSSLRPKDLGKIVFPSAFPIPIWYSLSSFSPDLDSFSWYMAEAHHHDRSVGYVKVMPSWLQSRLQKQDVYLTSAAVLNKHQWTHCVKMVVPWLDVFLCLGAKLSNISSPSLSECQLKKLPYLCTWLNVMMCIGSLLTAGHPWVHGCPNNVVL